MNRLFCYAQTETNALMKTRHIDDMRVYIALRQRADFKTGRLEHPSALKMTTGSIAREISLPAKERVAALTFTHKDVGHAIERLEALGLVDELGRNGRYLRLRLPMAAGATSEGKPSQNQTVRSDAKNGGQIVRKFVQNENVESLAAQGITKDKAGQIDQQIVRREPENGGQIVRSGNEKSAETVAGQRVSGGRNASLSTVPNNQYPSSVPRRGDESPSAPENQPHHAASRLPMKTEEKPEDRYQTAVIDAGGGLIMYADSEKSRRIYRVWSVRSVDVRDVQEAAREVIKSPTMKPTPNSIDELLTAEATRRNNQRRGTGRGSLVL